MLEDSPVALWFRFFDQITEVSIEGKTWMVVQLAEGAHRILLELESAKSIIRQHDNEVLEMNNGVVLVMI